MGCEGRVDEGRSLAWASWALGILGDWLSLVIMLFLLHGCFDSNTVHIVPVISSRRSGLFNGYNRPVTFDSAILSVSLFRVTHMLRDLSISLLCAGQLVLLDYFRASEWSLASITLLLYYLMFNGLLVAMIERALPMLIVVICTSYSPCIFLRAFTILNKLQSVIGS